MTLTIGVIIYVVIVALLLLGLATAGKSRPEPTEWELNEQAEALSAYAKKKRYGTEWIVLITAVVLLGSALWVLDRYFSSICTFLQNVWSTVQVYLFYSA